MKPRCFVICPIGGPRTPIRQRSDAVFDELIAPVVESRGLEPVRADMIAEPGDISVQVIQHALDDHLAIADMTGANANVFYELAIRHAVRRPCVCIFEEGDRVPFDIAAYRALPVVSTDMDALRSARPTLTALVDASLAGGVEDSPVAAALGPWRVCAPSGAVDRNLLEGIVLSYLHLSFTLETRKTVPADQAIEEARSLLYRLEAQLHHLTDSLGLPPPNELRELEKAHWKAGRGES